MREYSDWLYVLTVMPMLAFGAFMAGSIALSVTGDHLVASRELAYSGGYGYVEGIPADAPRKTRREDMDPGMEAILLSLRLAEGWEPGGMLYEDLQIISESAHSQIKLYQERLEYLSSQNAVSEEAADLARVRLQEAESRSASLRAAGESLRQAMIELIDAFESIGAVEP